jgi:hypothetical protein
MSKELQEYWDPTSSPEDKQEIFKNQIDWSDHEDEAEYEDEDPYCDEIGHHPVSRRYKYTNCMYCDIELVKRQINGETAYVDPSELKKLRQWNEMVSGGGK